MCATGMAAIRPRAPKPVTPRFGRRDPDHPGAVATAPPTGARRRCSARHPPAAGALTETQIADSSARAAARAADITAPTG